MQPTTAAELMTVVQASGLLSGEKLDRAENVARDAADAAEAGKLLMDAGLFTNWQMSKLLEGRSKGYFLGKYTLLSQLGAGAMGSVYLGEHRVMRHKVAIKVLARRLDAKPGYIQRFQQEARAAAAVSHPRLVRAFDVDAIGGLHFMVMDYVPGDNLRQIIQRSGPLSIEEAAEYTRQTAEGLDAAHRAGLIHRDIKPSNLILDDDKQVRVLDLGLAKIVDDDVSSLTLANDTKLIGTVDYLAPEQARDCHHIDARADIYSLGCSMYYFLCGQPPYNEGSLTQRIIQHQTVPPPDIRKLRPDCPDDLAAICHKMLAKKPEDRFQKAGEIAKSLQNFLAGRPVEISLADVGLAGADTVEFAAAPVAEQRSAVIESAPATAKRVADDIDIGLAPIEDEPAVASASAKNAAVASRSSAKPLPPKNPKHDKRVSPPGDTKSFARDVHDDTDPDPSSDGSETFVGFMEDWNAALSKAAESLDAAPSLDSGSFSSNVLDQIPQTSNRPPISGAAMGSSLGGATTEQSNVSSVTAGGLDLQAIRQRAMAMVSEEDRQTGTMTPALWFCIVAGVLLGLILVGVTISYVNSFQETKIEGKESTDGG